jgi:hypothetical protein
MFNMLSLQSKYDVISPSWARLVCLPVFPYALSIETKYKIISAMVGPQHGGNERKCLSLCHSTGMTRFTPGLGF